MELGAVAALVSAFVALIAVIVSTVIAFRQHKNNQILLKSTQRNEWNKELRDAISDFLGCVSMYCDTGAYAENAKNEDSPEIQEKLNDLRIRIRTAEARVSLMVQCGEPSQNIAANCPCTIRSYLSKQIEGEIERREIACMLHQEEYGSEKNSVGISDLNLYKKYGDKSEGQLTDCMHQLTRLIKLKDEDVSGINYDKYMQEDDYITCYMGISFYARMVLKHEWEKAKIGL